MRGPALQAARRAAMSGAPAWKRLAADPAPSRPAAARHPLADASVSLALRRRAEEIAAAFDAIEPMLRRLAPHQFDAGFAARAHAELRDALQLDIPVAALDARWSAPLDMGRLHARCVVGTFCRLVERGFDRSLANSEDGEDAPALIRRWGFHAIDVTPCADGRLSGVVDYILRVPPPIVAFRQSYAGAMFDVAAALRDWERLELGRWREARPNAAGEPTRFLKIGVYHRSSVDPAHEGCAAHGSDDGRAAGAVLARLHDYAGAVRAVHGADAEPATLLVGVDTDTDSIRVHVPDASGRMEVSRYVDSLALHDATATLARDAAKDAIREAVVRCAGTNAADPASEGMRWLCGYLLKNNLGQVDSVRAWHGGRYADPGHTERLIVVGDPVDDVQLRNLAFQAQMDTVEQGALDLDIGVNVLRGVVGTQDLAVPVLVHVRYDPRIPGSADEAGRRARRLSRAIAVRHPGVHLQAVIRAAGAGAVLVPQDDGPVMEAAA